MKTNLLQMILLYSAFKELQSEQGQIQYSAKILPPGTCLSQQDRINEIHQEISSLITAFDCGGTPGWRRVGYLDMTDSSQSCPTGLALRTDPPGQRSCRRAATGNGCSTIVYNTSNLQYNKVCGRVRGYQFGTAFGFFGAEIEQGIDGYYVSGVSLTHGQTHTHIWTFATSLSEVFDEGNAALYCPCVAGASPSVLPAFIGNDYFCESGVAVFNNQQNVFFADDPLWDGQNCVSSCCELNNPPYFTKTLPAPTTDNIELRICNILNGDTPIDQVEIYVQ